MNSNIFLISSLLLLQFPTSAIEISSTNKVNALSKQSYCQIEPENGEFLSNKQQLQTLASQITVKVIGDNNGGSGTLIGKQGNNYLVLTNSHVMRGVNSVKLQTSDGKNYSAQILPQNNFKKSDLVLLKFQTNQNYCLPDISATTPEIDTPLLAAGFSDSTGKIIFSEGKVKKTANLKEGYEIGYSSNIEQGMSGGAILNSMGQLVGINGKSAYPILDSGYVYKNGSRPSSEEIREMRKLSWGIPISTMLAQMNQDILTAYKLPLPKSTASLPQGSYTGFLGDLEQKAKQFTVRIDSSSNSNGSGIIIAKEGNTYTVLTVAHVVCEREDATKPCGGFNYEILAPDGKKYPVEKSSIKIEEGVDLAVVKFNSSENYQIATFADYNPNSYDYMFTAGYPKLKNNSPWRFTMGRIFNKEEGLLQTNQYNFQNNTSGSLQATNSLSGGYELVYSSITYAGMSGGPVLDTQGRVIGIHGKAEGQKAIDQKTKDCGVNSECQVQIGYSLGVPVSTFLCLVSRLGVEKPQKIENTPSSQPNRQEKNSIEEVILSVDVSGGNATASQWLERGNQLWRLGRHEEAVKAFDEAIKQKPSFAYLAYYGKGFTLVRQGKIQESIPLLEKAVKLKPDFATALRIQSVIYRKLKQANKGLLAINKAIELEPQNPNLYSEKSFILSDLKEYVPAEAAITEAIKLNPRGAFYNNRGIIYSEQKKWDLALADYNKAIQINPNDAKAYYNRGNIYSEQKKWDLALADYNKSIQSNPNNARAYYNRGNFYSEQKKWDLALADYDKAIETNPKYVTAYNNRGIVYYKQRKWDLALADFNKAIQINPKYVNAYYNRGNVYSEQKKLDLALADYNKGIQINPNNANAYYSRGNIYSEHKKMGFSTC